MAFASRPLRRRCPRVERFARRWTRRGRARSPPAVIEPATRGCPSRIFVARGCRSRRRASLHGAWTTSRRSPPSDPRATVESNPTSSRPEKIASAAGTGNRTPDGRNDSASVRAACRVVEISGTSMATPIVAGAATLARQYFADGYYPTGRAVPSDGFPPSAALVKAALVNGAQPMRGFAESGLPSNRRLRFDRDTDAYTWADRYPSRAQTKTKTKTNAGGGSRGIGCSRWTTTRRPEGGSSVLRRRRAPGGDTNGRAGRDHRRSRR